MEIETIVLLLVGISAVVLAVVSVLVVRKQPATVTGVIEAAQEALTDIERVAGAAMEYVLAAEQLWSTGRLAKDSRFGFVVTRLKGLFPEISEETIEDSIEAAVAWMKMAESKLGTHQ